MKNLALTALFLSLTMGAYAQEAVDQAIAVRPAEEPTWRAVDPDNLLAITTPDGDIYVELAPLFAPQHVAQVKTLVRAGFYDGLDFYRVIENFVAQGGDPANTREIDIDGTMMKPATLPLEADLPQSIADRFVPAQAGDLYAPISGFYDGFAVGHSPEETRFWAIHCYGVMAMARGTDKDSATSDFYIVNGQATRHLDQNMSVFGRVVMGMDVVQSVKRGDRREGSGVIANPDHRTPITKAVMVSDLPDAERLQMEVLNSRSNAFLAMLKGAQQRTSEFFFRKPPPVIDVCAISVPARFAVADGAEEE